MSENFVKRNDAAKFLKVSNDQLDEWVDKGYVGVKMQVNKNKYYDVSELVAFMEAPEYAPDDEPAPAYTKAPVVHALPYSVECDVMLKLPNGTHVLAKKYVLVNAVNKAQAIVLAEGKKFPHQLFIEPKKARPI
jgi:hypothetical protein